MQEGGGGEDGDIAEGIEGEQISIARDDQIGMTVDRELQKFIDP